jgi:hypothetical protein
MTENSARDFSGGKQTIQPHSNDGGLAALRGELASPEAGRGGVWKRHISAITLSVYPVSSQVGLQRANQVLRGARLFTGGSAPRIEDMEPDVTLDHLRHQGIHRAPARGNAMQRPRALCFLLQVPFDSLDLPPDTTDPVEQLFLFLDGMCHRKSRGRSLQGYRRGYMLVLGLEPVTQEERRPSNV